MNTPSCTAEACKSGKIDCPCPWACEVSEPEAHHLPKAILIAAVFFTVGFIFAIAVLGAS